MGAPTGYPFVYLCRECGKPAFYLSEIPIAGTLVRSDVIAKLDGSKLDGSVPSHNPILCGSCGAWLRSLNTKHITQAVGTA